jgi:hypothetical protein
MARQKRTTSKRQSGKVTQDSPIPWPVAIEAKLDELLRRTADLEARLEAVERTQKGGQ